MRYEGYQAVQVNRQITEEFKGILTDEKAAQIIEKYGFPEKVEKGWYYFRDTNFLNNFVTTYLTITAAAPTIKIFRQHNLYNSI